MSRRQEAGQRSLPATLQVSTFELHTGPLVVGAALIGAGAVIGLAGMVIGGVAVLSATRRWVSQLEVPPNELARQKWAQARAATQAGASAWQDGVPADARST
jgi:hypothetical protein